VTQFGLQLLPNTSNAMMMEFTVKPSGIGLQNGIRFDITRNFEEETRLTPLRGGISQLNLKAFPDYKDKPTDEPRAEGTPPRGSYDNDNDPRVWGWVGPQYNSDHIYSVDAPGITTGLYKYYSNNRIVSDFAALGRVQRRHNFNEFVRVRLDGNGFTPGDANKSGNAPVEGSRASDLIAWHSRIDLVPDTLHPVVDQYGQLVLVIYPDGHIGPYYRYQRNTELAGENEIELGYKNLGNL
jgi:hypothetical protein